MHRFGGRNEPTADWIGSVIIINPLSTTILTPTVTIGGVPARVTFSGLAPFFVGYYQVNVQVPSNAPVGSAVPVVLTIGGASSNTVTLAIQVGPPPPNLLSLQP